MMIEHKILITGTMGSGKTTAIAAVSEIEPVSTDVINSDESVNKEKTTVAFDYGQVTIAEGERLRIYGTPGQERFSFMWKILAKGALGVIILVDDTRQDPFSDLCIYLENFEQLIKEKSCVICLTRVDKNNTARANEFASFIGKRGLVCPIVAADIREKEDVLMILDLLFTQLYA